MSSFIFVKKDQEHIAVIQPNKVNYKCIGPDFTMTSFTNLKEAIKFIESNGYEISSYNSENILREYYISVDASCYLFYNESSIE